MGMLYFNRIVGKIFKLNKIPIGPKRVEYGAPLCIEYKNFRIVSKKFDFFGASEVAIINNIRVKKTKEISPDNIIYYDKKATPKDNVLDIDIFNPSQYGNSVCYYARSYQGNNINICTKFYEIDERFGILKGISDLMHLGGKFPKYGLYLSLTGTFLDGVDKILDKLTYKRELIPDHVVEFNSKDPFKPLYYGSYICLPEWGDDDIKEIVDNYILDDDVLIHNTLGTVYKKSYYVLDLNDTNDPELYDFDLSYNANELLHNLNNHDKTSLEKFVQINSDADNLTTIQNITTKLKEPNPDHLIITGLYNKLSPIHKNWLKETFPDLITKIKS
jgi:hypothetical protein